MKLFLKIGVSVLLSVAVLLMLEAFVKKGLQHNRNFKIAYIASQKINADVVANGACEIEMMLDPSIINKYVQATIYNLALNHSDYADNYLVLYEYLRHQKKPRLVLLFAIPEAFDSRMPINTFNTYRFAHLLSDPEIRETVRKTDPAYEKHSIFPFVKYSYYSNYIFFKALSGWRDLLAHKKIPASANGYIAPVFPWHLATYTKGPEDKTPIYFTWSKLQEYYFRKTLQLLKNNNIDVLVYHSPLYYEAVALQKNRQVLLDRIEAICNQYGVRYLQFDSLPMRYDRQNYYVSTNPTIPAYNNTIAGISVFNNYFGRFLQDSLPFIFNKEILLPTNQKKSKSVIIKK